MSERIDSIRSRRIGVDRVTIRDDRLVIHSPTEMEDWQVRAHRKCLIHFDGRTWQLVRKSKGDRGTIRYELDPWMPASMELTGPEIHYDDSYVEQREIDLAAAKRREVVAVVLAVASPFVGLLGAKTKRRLDETYGIDPVTATRRSVSLECWLIFVALGWLSISVMVTALGSSSPLPMGPFVTLILVLAPDAIVRYDRLLAEEPYPPGLYEWIWRRRDTRG